jgi:hypothetical protein
MTEHIEPTQFQLLTDLAKWPEARDDRHSDDVCEIVSIPFRLARTQSYPLDSFSV